MSRKSKSAVAAGIAASAIALVFGGIVAANILFDKEKTEQYAVSEAVTKVVVASDAGDVDVVAADTDHVTVRQTTRWLTDEPSPTSVVADGVLRLDDDCGGGWAVFRCQANYRITVPNGLDVEVDADAGDVSVTGVAGTLSLHSDAGSIHGTLLASARVEADSDAGNVRLAFRAAPTSVDADSDAGDVELDLPRAEYRLETDTDAGNTSVSGVVRYDLAASTVRASSDAGDVTIRGR